MTGANALRWPDARLSWTLYALAALSFATTLALPYVGEEGIYTIAAMEMKLRGDYVINTLYGTNHGQPPLLNWLIIPLADAIGWEHVLVASRLVAASATIATGLVLAWLAGTLTQDRRFAAFAALIYLTSDALLYHGWIAYTYPLFAFFTFAAIACLWTATVRKSMALAWVAAAAISCAALTKGQSAIAFYAVTAMVLLGRRELRGVLLRPGVIVPHVAAGVLYIVWHQHLIGNAQQSMDMATAMEKFRAFELRTYLHQLWWFPLESALRFVPASALAAYCWWRRETTGPNAPALEAHVSTCAWIASLNFLPYWLWPNTGIRYVMPLYPLAALLLAYALRRHGATRMRLVVHCLIATILFKYAAALWFFPAYQREFRGDQRVVAAEIEALSRGHALYATDVSATGLGVAAYIDAHRFPQQPVQWPPREWRSGFVLSHDADPAQGRVFREFPLGRQALYLLCRGVACEPRSAP